MKTKGIPAVVMLLAGFVTCIIGIEVITKMETYEKKEKRQFNKYDMAIGLFYGVGIFLGIGIFFVGGFMTMSGAGWGASLFGGGCFSLVFGLICHAVITLRRNDK